MQQTTNLFLHLLLLFSAAVSGQTTPHPEAAIVKLTRTAMDGSVSNGTGFVVSLEHGRAYIATASHVVEGGQIDAAFSVDPAHPRRAAVLQMEGGDPQGLAVVWVPKPPNGARALLLDDRSPNKGDPVYLIGFPLWMGGSLLRPGAIAGRAGRILIISVPSDEGDSGGPLLHDGRVVGVAVTKPGSAYVHAVPAAALRMALEGWSVPLPSPPSARASDPSLRRPTANGCTGAIYSSMGSSKPIHTSPAHSARTLVNLRSGTLVEVLGKHATWFHIAFDWLGARTEGWISTQNISDLMGSCPK